MINTIATKRTIYLKWDIRIWGSMFSCITVRKDIAANLNWQAAWKAISYQIEFNGHWWFLWNQGSSIKPPRWNTKIIWFFYFTVCLYLGYISFYCMELCFSNNNPQYKTRWLYWIFALSNKISWCQIRCIDELSHFLD